MEFVGGFGAKLFKLFELAVKPKSPNTYTLRQSANHANPATNACPQTHSEAPTPIWKAASKGGGY
jgi:hypothetical protein